LDQTGASEAQDGCAGPTGVPQSLPEQLLAVARSAALEEMASGIAHELNQPLGAIVTFAQAGERILQRPNAPLASVLEVLQLISKEALAAGAGIRRMRQLFARGALNKTRCSMAEVIHELAPLLEPLAAQAQVTFELDLQAELPQVSIDRVRVQHVICALARNAFDANVAAAGAPAPVRIIAGGDRYAVEVTVIDAGPGIPPAHQAQIFHPFFTTKPHGTGLGLACCRRSATTPCPLRVRASSLQNSTRSCTAAWSSTFACPR
jgi:C4-dicarboxylate-specific signal transduction histidine kinase